MAFAAAPAVTLRAGPRQVALLGGGIVSRVRRGENAGRELRHEFVVLRHAVTPLRRSPAGGFAASVAVPPNAELTPTRRAIAAWVSPRGKTVPIQTVGGWIDPILRSSLESPRAQRR